MNHYRSGVSTEVLLREREIIFSTEDEHFKFLLLLTAMTRYHFSFQVRDVRLRLVVQARVRG